MSRFQRRRSRVRAAIRRKRLDALLVTNETNVHYLTGFTGDSSYLLLSSDDEIICSDSRYTTQLERECPQIERLIQTQKTDMNATVARALRKLDVAQVGVEADSLSVAAHQRLADAVKQAEFLPTSGIVEKLREIKDAQEIRLLREAIRQAEQAFTALRATLAGHETERQIAAELEYLVRRCGGDGFSFEPVIAAGPNAALPHARASDARIVGATHLLIDWGANHRRYKSDLTRVLLTSRIPSKLKRIYGVVSAAQAAAIDAIEPGVPASQVDRAARSVIDDAGFGRYFGHGLGHGIGLDIHEGPRINSRNDEPLKPGMVITVEPGIYLPGYGGIRIEDDVLVTRTGHDVLSSLPKQLEEMTVFAN